MKIWLTGFMLICWLDAAFVYADLTVQGNYTVKTSKTVFTKQMRRLTEGIKSVKPLDGDYFKNKDGSIVRWDGKKWETTIETVRSLTGRDNP